MTHETERPKREDFGGYAEYKRAYDRWRSHDPERRAATRAWYAANREAVLEQKKAYFQENKEQIREYQRDYVRDRYHVDPEFRAKSIERAKAGNKARRPPGPAKTKLSDEERKERHAARERQRRRAKGIPERSASEGPQYGDYADKAEYRDAYNKWYQEKNRETINSNQRAYTAENVTEIRERDKKRYKDNPSRLAAIKVYRAKYIEALIEHQREYYKKNKAACLWRSRVRAQQVEQASPPWLTKEHWIQIEAIYVEAQRMTEETGVPHSVDHVWPLRGKNSCGLHVPWNMRVIPSKDNFAKHNKEPAE